MQTIGERIRTARTAAQQRDKAFSLRKFADSINVTPSYLSKVERDKEKPSIEFLRTIAAALDVDAATLDSWLLCAGHVPPDVLHALREDPTLCALVRRAYVQFVAMQASREGQKKQWPAPRA